MGTAYTPGLQVTRNAVVQKIRELPVRGRVLVSIGQRVSAESSVLVAELPGDLVIVRLAERMGLDVEDVTKGLSVRIGDIISEGDLLCETRTFFGWFRHTAISPAAGVVEFYTEANAHLGIRLPPIPMSVQAYIDGTITEIEPERSVTIECQGALIQGIFGVGGERRGIIRHIEVRHDRIVTITDLRQKVGDLKDAILIGGAQFDREAVQFSVDSGAAAIVTGSIDAESLLHFVGHEIGVSITGDEDVPLTLIITEGFGVLPISSSVTTLAKELNGKVASINGATQVRAGAVRPEIIVSANETLSARNQSASSQLEIGRKVRIIRVPYFGRFGIITDLPHTPEALESGAIVRVLKAKLDSGEEVTVPRANVELLTDQA